MNAPDCRRALPRLSVADFASIRKRPFIATNGCATRQHTTITSTTTTTTTTRSKETTQKIAHVILSLRNTHLNFNKIQAIQKKRLRHLQNLIRLKNETISQLVKRLENRTQFKSGCAKNNKYLGVVQCDVVGGGGGSIIRTVSGGEKFVRRRLAELCAAPPPHTAQYLFCEPRRNTEEDRRHMASLLTAVYERRVIVYEKNRRFEFLKLDDVESAKRLLLKYLQGDESPNNFDAD
uniref:DekiORF134 n=1 Tax=Dendrolimus kikuchii nucleopolyhedrovirus TaxID=1219875 RepID=V9LSR6_9ABAC|nr:DekiORF134 [Dendrolimus kikuchii nucleopolyhedrovirus]